MKAADAVTDATTGRHLQADGKELAGNLVHYVTGALIGVAYGIAAEYRPEVTEGMGNLLGGATSLLLDEGAVPALGLADKAAQVPASNHLFGLSAHAVFGMAAEAARGAVVAAFPR